MNNIVDCRTSYLLVILGYSFLLSSCVSQDYISIHQNGSATVTSDVGYLKPEDASKYFESTVISKIDTSYYQAKFEINTIDSLGNYLYAFPERYLRFRLDGNTLNITDGHTSAQGHKWLSWGMYVTIEFDKEISDVQSENSTIKKINPNTIMLSTSRRLIKKGKKRINVKVTTQ